MPINPPIHICINIINNIPVFKVKDGYKLEIQTPETIKLFGSTKKINRQKIERRKCAKSWSGWCNFKTMQSIRQLTSTTVWGIIYAQ